jgi:hypothetical protein
VTPFRLRLVRDAEPPDDPFRPLTGAERTENLRRARAQLERLHGLGADAADLEAGAGVCDDCGHDALMRWKLGRVTCCRVCFMSRRIVADKTGAKRAA